MSRLASEIGKDREALLRIMKQLGVPARDYKVIAGWMGKKAGRLKPQRTWLAVRRSARVDELCAGPTR